MRLALALAAVVAVAGVSNAAAKPLLTTSVDPNERGRAIPHSFLGFSIEPNASWVMTGMPGDLGPNTVYQGFLKTLAAYGGGVPTMRLGGNYQDGAWWNPLDKPLPLERGIFVNIQPPLLQGLAAHVVATGQKVTYGLNLATNDPRVAADEARAVAHYVPRRYIAGFEVGNEPDFYPQRVKYEQRDSAGRVVKRTYSRPRGYDGRTFMREWNRVATAVRKAAPRIPLVGTAGYGVIVSPAKFVRSERKRLAFYTEHSYPLAGCAPNGHVYQPGEKNYPSLARLLGKAGTQTTIAQLKRGAHAAHRYRKRYVVDETNSVSCKSRPEVSASFGTALWGVDELFTMVSAGVDGVDFHVGDPNKSAIGMSPLGGGRWQGNADPLYYGMLAFAHAVGRNGRQLLYPTFAARPIKRGLFTTHVWAVRDGRTLRLMVVNKDLKKGGTVQIRVPGGRSTGQIARLSAPSLTARRGLSFGGQTIPSPTYDGQLTGSWTTTPVRPKRGVYSFNMPRASAALLTIR